MVYYGYPNHLKTGQIVQFSNGTTILKPFSKNLVFKCFRFLKRQYFGVFYTSSVYNTERIFFASLGSGPRSHGQTLHGRAYGVGQRLAKQDPLQHVRIQTSKTGKTLSNYKVEINQALPANSGVLSKFRLSGVTTRGSSSRQISKLCNLS